MAISDHVIPIDEGPAVYYLATDGALIQLDEASDLTRMDERERAIARALVNYATTRLNRVELDAMVNAGMLDPAAVSRAPFSWPPRRASGK
jgi:hypothetical protein